MAKMDSVLVDAVEYDVARGYVLEETVSPIDGSPIVVIVTMNSANVKTGNMCQVWILRSDMAPTDAVKCGADRAICGDCPHRANGDFKHRMCYVIVFQAPLSVYRMYKRGGYPQWQGDTEMFANRKVRWGAYGDPSLISVDIVQKINSAALGWTGYTHQWQATFASEFRSFFQASCDSRSDLETASKNGWGTFTVLSKGFDVKDLGRKVTLCPSAKTDGNVKCIECGLCNGSHKFAHQIVIEAHGRGADAIEFS